MIYAIVALIAVIPAVIVARYVAESIRLGRDHDNLAVLHRADKVTNRARRDARNMRRAMDHEAAIAAEVRAQRIEAALAARGWGLGQ